MNNYIIPWTTSDAPSMPSRPQGFSFEPNPDAHGYVNWMEPCEPGHQLHDTWCKVIGEEMAKKHEGKKDPSGYYMDGLPEGYALFIHHKTFRDKSDRNDRYLYGSSSVLRFRSPGEFTMHALWLMRGARASDPCGCIYCTGAKSQIDINKRNGLSGLKYHPERKKRSSVP